MASTQGRIDPLAAVREAGRAAGQAAPPLNGGQMKRLRVLLRGQLAAAA